MKRGDPWIICDAWGSSKSYKANEMHKKLKCLQYDPYPQAYSAKSGT